jgi:DNA/RNA endonuclease G (NUC1)
VETRDDPMAESQAGCTEIAGPGPAAGCGPGPAEAAGPAAQAASWRVSNVAVQDAGLNSGAWARLTGNVRAWACRFGTVYTVTGTIHRPGGRPPLAWSDGADIDVPDAF